MKKGIIFLLSLSLWACGEKSTHEGEHNHNEAEAGMVNIKLADLASKQDPTCSMDLEEGAIADTMMVEGKIYGFCNKGCKEEYKKTLQK